jgi:hypothetical protein
MPALWPAPFLSNYRIAENPRIDDDQVNIPNCQHEISVWIAYDSLFRYQCNTTINEALRHGSADLIWRSGLPHFTISKRKKIAIPLAAIQNKLINPCRAKTTS